MTADIALDPLERIEVVHRILGDTLAVLKAREAFPLSVPDLPDIRAALEAAIYDVDSQVHGPCRSRDTGPCRGCAIKLAAKARWTVILRRLNGKAAA